jgi:hypothetical protein
MSRFCKRYAQISYFVTKIINVSPPDSHSKQNMFTNRMVPRSGLPLFGVP